MRSESMIPAGQEPTRDEVEQIKGPVVLEFGASWCGYCQAFQPHLNALLQEYPNIRYIWVEDGKGQPLGRSFRVKLWPTLVFLRDGQVVAQMARPAAQEARQGFQAVTEG